MQVEQNKLQTNILIKNFRIINQVRQEDMAKIMKRATLAFQLIFLIKLSLNILILDNLSLRETKVKKNQ